MSDKDYKEISMDAYRVDRKKVEQPLRENQKLTKSNFKILQVEDNQENGMQAMAVAPVNDRGEVDTSKIEHEFQTIDGIESSIFFDKKYAIIIKRGVGK